MFKTARLFYFTGTGNTLALAKAAADTLVAQGVETEVTNIIGYEHDEPPGLIGVFFPVYGFGAPRIVNRFLKKLPHGNGSAAFVITNAAETAGPAADMVAVALSQKGYRVLAAEWVKMPSNYILGKQAIAESEAQAIVFAGEQKTKDLVTTLLDPATSSLPFKPRWQPLHRLMYWGFLKGLPYSHRFYKYTDKCTGCGGCVEMCPTGCIALNPSERPVWNRGCEHCLRCVNLCPTAAIEVGSLTKGKRRYTFWRGKV